MTYLFIHGGGCSARYWDRVVAALEAPALAIDMPGRGDRPGDLATQTLDVEAQSIVKDAQLIPGDEPFVLVAHSSGGLVVPRVAEALAGRVERIVLNAALVPPEGGLGIDCMKPAHREGLLWALEDAKSNGTTVTLPGAPEDPESFREAYGGDPLNDSDLRFITDPACMVPDTVHHYFQPVTWNAVREIPVTYLFNEFDRPVRPHMQQAMLERLPGLSDVVRLPSGHIPAVTHVAAFVAALSGGTV